MQQFLSKLRSKKAAGDYSTNSSTTTTNTVESSVRDLRERKDRMISGNYGSNMPRHGPTSSMDSAVVPNFTKFEKKPTFTNNNPLTNVENYGSNLNLNQTTSTITGSNTSISGRVNDNTLVNKFF